MLGVIRKNCLKTGWRWGRERSKVKGWQTDFQSSLRQGDWWMLGYWRVWAAWVPSLGDPRMMGWVRWGLGLWGPH